MIDISLFRKDGIVFPAGKIDVDGFIGRYAEFQQKANDHRGRDLFIKPHIVSSWIDGIARHPDILDIVEQAIGPDIVLWESDWSVKRAGTGDYVPWHQDSPYWNLSTDKVVSVWLAFGDVTDENGPMEVVPGTHTDGQIGRVNADGNLFEAYQDGQRQTDENCMFPFAHLDDSYASNAINVELKAGEFSIHDVNLVHGGGPNPSDRDRIAIAMRYISADTRYIGEVDSVTAVRGDCERDYFVFEPRPDGEFTAESLTALDKALDFPSGFGEKKRAR